MSIYYVVGLFTSYLLNKREIKLSKLELAFALIFKILMACLYGYIFFHFYGGDDTWAFHQQGLREYEKMRNDTGQFFRDLLPTASFADADGWWQGITNYLRNLEHFTFHKLLALFNFFSGDNYYINATFFSFITFWGHYLLYRLIVSEFPDKRTLIFLLIFFFPPTVFWLSGLRTDGIIFLFLSIALFHFNRWIKTGKVSSFIYCGVGLLGVLIYRNVLLLLLLPTLLSWFVVVRYKTRPALTFLMVFGLSIILFFGSLLLSPTKNLPNIVAERQKQFFALKGNTVFALDTLQPGVGSFLRVLPQSINNTFFRPYPWEASGALQLVTAGGIIIFWLLVLLAILRKDKPWKEFFQHPLILFLLFFSVSLYLFTGYTVPFPGAIVRYKCIPELMLLLVIVSNIRWKTGVTIHDKK